MPTVTMECMAMNILVLVLQAMEVCVEEDQFAMTSKIVKIVIVLIDSNLLFYLLIYFFPSII
jgi:hypothetical protein